MPYVATHTLIEDALHYAVARAEDKLITVVCGSVLVHNGPMLSPSKSDPLTPYTPSANWLQGGPIIEHRRITTRYNTALKCWEAHYADYCEYGSTLLIAAMRVYAAERFDGYVNIPAELLPKSLPEN